MPNNNEAREREIAQLRQIAENESVAPELRKMPQQRLDAIGASAEDERLKNFFQATNSFFDED